MRIEFGDGCSASTLGVIFDGLVGWTLRADGRDGVFLGVTRDGDGTWFNFMALDEDDEPVRGDDFRVDPWSATIEVY